VGFVPIDTAAGKTAAADASS